MTSRRKRAEGYKATLLRLESQEATPFLQVPHVLSLVALGLS